jgi:hypothetical protein
MKSLKNYVAFFQVWYPIVPFILLCICSCGGTPQTPKQGPVIQNNDSTLLFDGESLDGWEITNFGPQGPVNVSGGAIILGMGDGCTGVTWKKKFPEINYKVTLEAKRIAGNDFFCGVTFPVGKDPCTLIVGGWGGTTVGLSSIDGKDAAENETTRLMKFEKDHWYKISIVVTEAGIKAWIDTTIVVNFFKGNKTLSIRPEVALSKPFGIASWNTTAAVRDIRVVRLKD